ncbi:hypothetical protein J7F01_00445 [Streptomyces sp. ISL-22]|uniref:Uncharacterized protein n=1 Tax=Streptomyces curacoi TaxID=146536 RepID=A0A117P891_9ACTN|nr:MULTISPECIES: hypothetical protein [Streptomyces]KUM74804.1 hypothetical protein AQI70_18445 [Streptomyces curacoi]MBT2421425.1 hypothetical protein [Streptomyces sp. ISL-24]MBT2430694.1 hypothetical protein [Streptomyces sp. ISL-22]
MTTPHEADTQVEQLRAALAANGVTLPSLRVDLPSLTALPARPLVALGNCNLATVQALTAVLRKAAAR